MEVYTNADEQADLVRNWLKKYGVTIILGVIIGLSVVYGWRYWQQKQQVTTEKASIIYQQMLDNVAADDQQQTQVLAKNIIDNFPNSAYAAIAKLILAKLAIDKGDSASAVKYLSEVIADSHGTTFAQIARIRQARIFLAQMKYDEALKLLEKVDNKAYRALIDEVRGDIFVAQHNIAAARQAYQNALNSEPESKILKPVIVMKLNSLAADNKTGVAL